MGRDRKNIPFSLQTPRTAWETCSEPGAGSAAPVTGRCCSLIPDLHQGCRGMRCPERGSLSPRCSGWSFATGAGSRWLQATGSPRPVATAGLRARRRERELLLGCVLAMLVCSEMPGGARFPLPSEDGEKCSCLCFRLKRGFAAPSPLC